MWITLGVCAYSPDVRSRKYKAIVTDWLQNHRHIHDHGIVVWKHANSEQLHPYRWQTCQHPSVSMTGGWDIVYLPAAACAARSYSTISGTRMGTWACEYGTEGCRLPIQAKGASKADKHTCICDGTRIFLRNRFVALRKVTFSDCADRGGHSRPNVQVQNLRPTGELCVLMLMNMFFMRLCMLSCHERIYIYVYIYIHVCISAWIPVLLPDYVGMHISYYHIICICICIYACVHLCTCIWYTLLQSSLEDSVLYILPVISATFMTWNIILCMYIWQYVSMRHLNQMLAGTQAFRNIRSVSFANLWREIVYIYIYIYIYMLIWDTITKFSLAHRRFGISVMISSILLTSSSLQV